MVLLLTSAERVNSTSSISTGSGFLRLWVLRGHAHSQIPRQLAHTSSVSGSVMRTQGFGALAPQPVGPSGQLRKEQTLPDAEDLFSRYGVGTRSIRQRASRKNMLSRC